MKFSDLTQKTVSELFDLYGNLKKEQLNYRLQVASMVQVKPKDIRDNRRNLARIKTKLQQLKLAKPGV